MAKNGVSGERANDNRLENNIELISRVTMPLLAMVSVLGIIYFFWNVTTLTNRYSQEIALRDAIRFHTAINTFRNYYSTQIVGSLRGGEIDFTHDYHDKENALPLPATLTRELGNDLSSASASSMNFYSDDPFPWREAISAEDDPFLAEALIYLRENPTEVYYQTETNLETGDRFIRYATPSVMGQTCVDCHNNHPDSPRKDWEVGDVRGILEVSVPVSTLSLRGGNEAGNQLVISSILLLLSSFGLIGSGFYFRNLSLKAIEQKSQFLEAEVAERIMAEARLVSAKEEAQRANLAKSRFLATMSHELRTPLNAIIGYSEMLEEEAEEDDDVDLQDSLGRITRSGRHLLTIINDILDLSKIEIGRLDVAPGQIELEGVMQYIDDLMAVLISNDAIQFKMISDGEVDTFNADETRLRQILFNLLSNAAKFTSKGTITLYINKVRFEGRTSVQFTVEDTGIGMSDDNMKDIFNPFVQLESGTDRKYQGSGLGLAITKNLCELMNGEIWVESELGVGTVFTVVLPIEQEEEKGAYTRPEKEPV